MYWVRETKSNGIVAIYKLEKDHVYFLATFGPIWIPWSMYGPSVQPVHTRKFTCTEEFLSFMYAQSTFTLFFDLHTIQKFIVTSEI